MKYTMLHLWKWAVCALLGLTTTGCHRSSSQVWEDTKTCGRYLDRGMRSLMGQHIDPREYTCNNWEEDAPYIPLEGTQTGQGTVRMHTLAEVPPARESPGDPGSKIPGIDKFSPPMGPLARLFETIHFETDNYTIKGERNVAALRAIAKYLSAHSDTYVFVEGHADERGAAAYNLALGARRANAIRAFLVDNGVDADHLFTISYGKEKPLTLEHDESAWSKNRRGQFKLYER